MHLELSIFDQKVDVIDCKSWCGFQNIASGRWMHLELSIFDQKVDVVDCKSWCGFQNIAHAKCGLVSELPFTKS